MMRLWKRAEENLFVLTLLAVVSASWTFDRHQLSDHPGKYVSPLDTLPTNNLEDGFRVEIMVETTANASTLQYYLSQWSGDTNPDKLEENTTYYGEGLPEVLFHSSTENSSLIFRDMSRCMEDFQFLTCLKFLLVNRLDDLLGYLKENNLTNTNFSYGCGIVSFESVPGMNHYDYESVKGRVLDLDEDIRYKTLELFKDRSLQLNLLPGLELDVVPVLGDNVEDFIGFRAKPFFNWNFWRNDDAGSVEVEGRAKRGSNKRKKGGFKMPSMMIMPQLIMWGTMPFVLANLQAMVMNAFMMNMMALNSAIFMTIRNLVFGPKGGPKIKYVNYGYKKKKSSVPTIIVHSPAAFVKQPFHKFRRHKRPSMYQNHFIPPENIFVAEETPMPYSQVYKSNNHEENFHDEEVTYDEYHNEFGESRNVPLMENQVRVYPEGHFHGKNRVRISVKQGAMGMRELLHRVRVAESEAEILHGFREPAGRPKHSTSHIVQEFGSAMRDDTPWTASQPTSHSFSETHNTGIGENVDYAESEFRPMLTYPEKLMRH